MAPAKRVADPGSGANSGKKGRKDSTQPKADSMVNSSAKLVLNLERRAAMRGSVVDRAFFVQEGADSLGAECAQANKKYDDDS
eukprot:5607745-Pyramimonas_sp.AAC.1